MSNTNLNTRWHEATNELIFRLEQKGIKFENLDALEMFARDGTWHTIVFANKVKSLEAWEIDPKWKNELKMNLPKAKIRIIDSVKTIQKNITSFTKFNLILIDNPQNTYGPKLHEYESYPYCEHFDVIQKIDKLIDREALVIFNVNNRPFNYDSFPLWEKRRKEFYKCTETSNLSIDFLFNFYRDLFNQMGLKTIFHLNIVRVFYNNVGMTHYFAFQLQKI